MPKNNSEITVAYWSTKGLGAPSTTNGSLLWCPFKMYFLQNHSSSNSWMGYLGGLALAFGSKASASKNKLLSIYLTLKFMMVMKKIVVAQSIACMTLLARELDMQGSDRNENSQKEQLLL